MYSLPIRTFSDYWRTAGFRSAYFGGTVVLLAGMTLQAQPGKIAKLPKVVIPEIEPAKTETMPEAEKRSPPVPSTRLTVDFRLEDIEIPLMTEYKESDEVPPGMSRVKEDGEKGLKRRVIKIVQMGGEIAYEQMVYEFELKAPKKRVVIQNNKPITGEPLDLNKLQVSKVFTVEATAYTYTGNPTATGVYPRVGLIAVDPKVIPLGSRVYVEGYGYAIAADTGGAIKGNKVDVFFSTLSKCLEWGRRPVKLYLLAGK